MTPKPKITLDNNCIINLFDKNSTTATSVEDLLEIVRLVHEGVAEMAITTRVEADLENDSDSERQATLMSELRSFDVVGTLGRWDTSKWDAGDSFSDQQSNRLADEIQKIVFPGGLKKNTRRFKNKQNDIDHLVGHKINNRDIFVTDDVDIVRKAETLKRSPGIVVMRPSECLKFLLDQRKRLIALPLESQRAHGDYKNSQLSGKVSFNFTNNNGRYSLGGGIFHFETAWSSASASSVHVYTDPPSIDSLAIAEGATTIGSVKNASDFDFSSRVRTPSEGNVVLIQNINGFFCALKVLDVRLRNRGDDRDELTFEYKIQTNGSSDFSNGEL